MFYKTRLLTPGPTMIPERVQKAMSLPILYHRSPEFTPLFNRVRDKLKNVFLTSQDVLVLCASGSGAMEATVGNLFQKGETVIVVEAGKFGQRWAQLASVFGLNVVTVSCPWGTAVSQSQLEKALQENPNATGLLMQASETSTGVFHPIENLSAWKKKHPHLLWIVDGITGVGTAPLRMDEWGIDVLVSGSQKAFMLPPGLAFAALSEKAWKKAETLKGKVPVYYFDLNRERKNQAEGTTSWTPAISLIMGLDEALSMMMEEGIEAIFQRHARLARSTRAAGIALGLELFAPEHPSAAITAFRVPTGVEGGKIVKAMRELFGYTIAGGQDHLKGKVFRLGHMGFTDAWDMVGALSALEMTLKSLQWNQMPKLGTGVSAFLKSWDE